MKKHLIFDCDGTLIDSEKNILKALHDLLLEEKGLDEPYEKLVKAMGHPGLYTMRKYGFEDPVKAMNSWNERIVALSEKTEFFEGMEETLAVLKERGYHLGVITSRDRYEYEYASDQLALKRFMEVTVTADETVGHKPDKDPMLKYLEKSGADIKECIYIGDTKNDYLCALNSGVDFILASWGSDVKLPDAVRALSPSDLLKIFK